ncbi:MAG: GTP cyclohydrolase I FolE [Clostridia bacterium]|nr:GTP cyclohydrolase I FolE [Clostridia bacterium]
MVDKLKIKQLTREFIIAIGDDPDREGVVDTPRRVADMCEEILDPTTANMKYTIFNSDNYDGIVLVRDISFSSLCEHHLLPFIGKIHLAYIPDTEVIGLSKLARLVDKHSKRLQLQERLANEIVADMSAVLNPKGIAIYIEAKHLCMTIRGVKRPETATVTTVFTGLFKEFHMQEMFFDMIQAH